MSHVSSQPGRHSGGTEGDHTLQNFPLLPAEPCCSPLLLRAGCGDTPRCPSFGASARSLTPLRAQGKLRLDAFLSARAPRCSRARVQDSIRRGHVAVNGAVMTKTAAAVQPGDAIDLVVYEPAPIAAAPEVRCAST